MDTRKDSKELTFRPIGLIHTPYKTTEGVPIQGGLAPDTEGVVELKPELEAGLEGIEGFSHLILIYAFDRSMGREEVPLRQRPFLDETERGVFAIRSPLRPNPLGLTVVRLKERQGNRLLVRGVDMLDGTPLLDIKPYVARFDAPEGFKSGWLEDKLDKAATARSDGRFSRGGTEET